MTEYLSYSSTDAQESSPGAGASPSTPSPSNAPGGSQFQAVDGGTETHSGSTLLVEAYAVLWVILMGWILLLWRKQASLNARIDELDRVLDKAAAKRSAKTS